MKNYKKEVEEINRLGALVDEPGITTEVRNRVFNEWSLLRSDLWAQIRVDLGLRSFGLNPRDQRR